MLLILISLLLPLFFAISAAIHKSRPFAIASAIAFGVSFAYLYTSSQEKIDTLTQANRRLLDQTAQEIKKHSLTKLKLEETLVIKETLSNVSAKKEQEIAKEKVSDIADNLRNWMQSKSNGNSENSKNIKYRNTDQPLSNILTPTPLPPFIYQNKEKGISITTKSNVAKKSNFKAINVSSDVAWAYPSATGYGMLSSDKQDFENTITEEDALDSVLHNAIDNFSADKTSEKRFVYTTKNGETTFKNLSFLAKLNNYDVIYFISVNERYGYLHQISSWTTVENSTSLRELHFQVLDGFSSQNMNHLHPGTTIRSPYASWNLSLPKQSYDPVYNSHTVLPGHKYTANTGPTSGLAIYEYKNQLNLTNRQLLIGAMQLLNHDNVSEFSYSQYERNSLKISQISAPYEQEGTHNTTEIHLLEKDQNTILLAYYYEKGKRSEFAINQLWDRFEWLSNPAPLNSDREFQKNQAIISNRLAMGLYYSGDYLTAEKLCAEAIIFHPEFYRYHSNRIHALIELDRNKDALEAIKLAKITFKNNKDLSALEASILVNMGNTLPGYAIYEQLFKEGYNNENALYNYLDSIIVTNPERAIISLDHYLKLFPSHKIRRWKSSALTNAKKYDEAIQLLQNEVLSESPNDTYAIELLIENYQLKEDFTNALTLVRKLATLDQNSISTQIWEATILRQLNKYQDSHDKLTTLSKKYPDNFEVKNALSQSSAALGLGDHALIRNMISPVPLSEKLITLKEKHSHISSETEAETDFYLKSKIVNQKIEKSGRITKTTYENFVITKESGISYLSNRSVTFNPIYEKVFVNSVKVTNQGTIAYQGKLNELFISDDSSELETHDKTLNIPVKSLEIGSEIEVVYTIESWDKENSIPFANEWLGSVAPTRFMAYAFSGNIENLVTHSSLPIQTSTTDKEKILWISAVQNYKSEVYQPDIDTIICQLSYGDSNTSWKEVSADYHQHIASRFESNPALENTINQILSTASSKEDKIKAAVDWVQHKCIYRGIEFGPRGRMPQDPATIIQDKSGDCKDKSLLLWHMLTQLGVNCQLALANTSTKISESIPSENQFNHIVLYCPDFPQKVIDPTITNQDILKFAPYYMVGNLILPVTKEGHKLVTVSPSENALRIDVDKTLAKDQETLITTDTITFYGYTESYYRSAFKLRTPTQQQEFIYSIASQYYPDITVDEVEVLKGLDTYTDQFTLKVVYSSDFSKEIPVPFEQNYLRVDPTPKRVNSIYNKFPLLVNCRIYKQKDQTLKIKNKPFDSNFTNLKITTDEKTNLVQISSLIKPLNLPPSEFNPFRKSTRKTIPSVILE
ncbi:DUF3857 domain-containing protein [Akkermansiaceae bacterium]|nr:DUF3857 domain-containing protein [Akkermansiaceae bacterium]